MDQLKMMTNIPDKAEYPILHSNREEILYVGYKPPSRDAIHLPNYVTYLLMAALIVVAVAYAIVGHLVKDLIHDFADWVLGPNPNQEDSNEECTDGILYVQIEETELDIKMNKMDDINVAVNVPKICVTPSEITFPNNSIT